MYRRIEFLFACPAILLFSLFSVSCGLPPGPNTAPDFLVAGSQTIVLSSSTVDSINPQIAVDVSQRIFVTWQDNTNNIWYTSSTDGGSSFVQPPTEAIGGRGGSFPRITTDGHGNIFLASYAFPNVYLDYVTSTGFQYTVMLNTQNVPSPQSSVAPPADLLFNPSDNSIGIAWSQGSNCALKCDIYFNQVENLSTLPITSANFLYSPPVQVSNGQGLAFYPKLALDGAIPYILFTTTNCINGTTSLCVGDIPPTYPSQNIPLWTVGNTIVSNSSSLYITGNKILAAWNPTSAIGSDIFFNFLELPKTLFSDQLDASLHSPAYGPVIGVDANQYIYIAFFSEANPNSNNFNLFMVRSVDGGNTFTAALNISNSSGNSLSYAPGMVIIGKTAYLVWDDNGGTGTLNHQIFFKKITLS